METGGILKHATRWDRAAYGWSQRAAWIERTNQPLTDWLLSASDVRAGQRLLEIAAGQAQPARSAALKAGPLGYAVAADYSFRMLTSRGTPPAPQAGTIALCQCAVEQLPFRSGVFDVAMSRLGLHLSVCLDTAIQEVRRVLSPRGILTAVEWKTESNPWLAIPGQILNSLRGRDDARETNREEAGESLHSALLANGFAKVETAGLTITCVFSEPGDLLEHILLMSHRFRAHEALRRASPSDLAEAARRVCLPHTQADGSIEIPSPAFGILAAKEDGGG